jgi:hypothetical protein
MDPSWPEKIGHRSILFLLTSLGGVVRAWTVVEAATVHTYPFHRLFMGGGTAAR